MKSFPRLALTALSLLSLASVAGCAADTTSSGDAQSNGARAAAGPVANPSPAPGAAESVEEAIAEADIIQLDGSRLFALTKSGTVALVDVSAPGRVVLRGTARVAGEPFEMYRRKGEVLLTLSNGVFGPDGARLAPQTSQGSQPSGASAGATSATAAPNTGAARDPRLGAGLVVLDTQDPAKIREIATLPVPGEIADSRVVGDILYLVTYQDVGCRGCATTPRTVVTSFDVASPAEVRQVDQVVFSGAAPNAQNIWGGHAWKRSVFATKERLYVGGHTEADQAELNGGAAKEGVIDVLDITDPTGRFAIGARLSVTGAMLSRWQLDEQGGVLRVVSQRGAGRTRNGVGMPEIETFSVQSSQAFAPLGRASIKLPTQEGLRTVRFDGDRAYAITYAETDPLFTIDLADPAAPRVRGELHMPGFMYHLEPRGDRVLGLGIDRNDRAGNLNVSLFDVGDLARPKMLKRVSFGGANRYPDATIASGKLGEDQDRIQKAFRIFDSGLVVVPFSQIDATGQAACARSGSGIQLFDWNNDALTLGALLPMVGRPRRAFEKDAHVIGVSDSHVAAFSLGQRGGALTSEVQIGTCETRSFGGSSPGMGMPGATMPNDFFFEGDDSSSSHRGLACSAAPGSAGATPSAGWLGLGVLGAVLGLARRRRAA